MSGVGAELNAGRWNFPGIRAVYCEESFIGDSGNVGPCRFEDLLQDRILLSIEITREVQIATKEIKELENGWNDFLNNEDSQKIFGLFVKENRAAVPGVPSVMVPEEFNYILNPLHPDFPKIKVTIARTLNLATKMISTGQ